MAKAVRKAKHHLEAAKVTRNQGQRSFVMSSRLHSTAAVELHSHDGLILVLIVVALDASPET